MINIVYPSQKETILMLSTARVSSKKRREKNLQTCAKITFVTENYFLLEEAVVKIWLTRKQTERHKGASKEEKIQHFLKTLFELQLKRKLVEISELSACVIVSHSLPNISNFGSNSNLLSVQRVFFSTSNPSQVNDCKTHIPNHRNENYTEVLNNKSAYQTRGLLLLVNISYPCISC